MSQIPYHKLIDTSVSFDTYAPPVSQPQDHSTRNKAIVCINIFTVF